MYRQAKCWNASKIVGGGCGGGRSSPSVNSSVLSSICTYAKKPTRGKIESKGAGLPLVHRSCKIVAQSHLALLHCPVALLIGEAVVSNVTYYVYIRASSMRMSYKIVFAGAHSLAPNKSCKYEDINK